MKWSHLLILIFCLASWCLAQESQYQGSAERSKAAYKQREKGLSREERKKLEEFATTVDAAHSYETADSPVEDQLKENSRIFPIFVGCTLFFLVLLSYNYLIGLTANKEKLLKELEASSNSKQVSQQQETINKINKKK
ncbi:MAG: hypothetical protein AABZ60_10595 [Planctomycetota bacterium]